MLHKRIGAVAAIGLTAALVLSACGSTSNTGSNATTPATTPATTAESPGTTTAGSPSPTATSPTGTATDTASSAAAPPAGAGKTLTVWAMNGDLSAATLDAINAEFTKETGAKVDVQTQQWSGITTKITTALATSTPPDVLDLGNTQIASFAANGGLMDLTAHQSDLQQGQTWLGGLVDPATVDGKLFGVPSFAGVRAVIYNKTTWNKAGVDSAPTTWANLNADLDKVKAANTSNSNFSAFYLPGQYWYAGYQFIWDAGGQVATQSNGKWVGGMSSPEAQKGLNAFKTFQNTYSSVASRTLNTDKPDQNQIFADGNAAAILGNNGDIASIIKDNPKLTDADLGTFPMPGESGKTQPVMTGGSDWGIAAKSQNQDLALTWVKIAAGPDIQTNFVFGKDGWIPNSTQATQSAANTAPEIQKAFFMAALNSTATPASPNWATLEGNNVPNNLFASIASGTKSPADAAASFDSTVNSTLNG